MNDRNFGLGRILRPLFSGFDEKRAGMHNTGIFLKTGFGKKISARKWDW